MCLYCTSSESVSSITVCSLRKSCRETEKERETHTHKRGFKISKLNPYARVLHITCAIYLQYLTTILPHALLSFSFYTFLMDFFFFNFLKILPFSYVCSIVFKVFLKKIFLKKKLIALENIFRNFFI